MQAQKKTQPPQLRLSILIADDDIDTVFTLEELLRDEGHIVHTCADAKLVVEAVQRYRPDICFLDIVMPGKTGFAIARELMAMRLEHRPVLVAMSGVSSSPSDEVIARSAGFDHFIRKGEGPRILLALINQYAGGHPSSAA